MGLGDNRDQFSSDGRRLVVGETAAAASPGGGGGVGGPTSAMSDIAEELATPAVVEPDSQSHLDGKDNGGRLDSKPQSEDEDEGTYADVVKHGNEGSDDDEGGDDDGELSRKNSNDRLLD